MGDILATYRIAIVGHQYMIINIRTLVAIEINGKYLIDTLAEAEAEAQTLNENMRRIQ